MPVFLAGLAQAARTVATQAAKKAGTSAAKKAAGSVARRRRSRGGLPDVGDVRKRKKLGPVALIVGVVLVLSCFAGSAVVTSFAGMASAIGGAAAGSNGGDPGSGAGAGCGTVTDVTSTGSGTAADTAGSFQFPQASAGGPFSQGGPGRKPGAVPSSGGGAFPNVDQLSVMKAAGAHYNVPWYLLAAISWQETKHGSDPDTWKELASEGDGAMGNMRFTPGTWADFGVDDQGHKATAADRSNWQDQLWSAANMLSNWDGMPGLRDANDVLAAIHRYNWHDWYTNDILWWAAQYAAGNTTVSGGGACGLPIDNQFIAKVIQWELDQRGKPYVMGGTGPDVFDCSGLMMMAWRQIGIDIPRTASTQADASNIQIVQRRPIDVAQLQPGDMLFYDAKPSESYQGSYSQRLGVMISHVIMYMGNDQVVEATPPRVISSTYTEARFQGFIAVGRVTGLPTSAADHAH